MEQVLSLLEVLKANSFEKCLEFSYQIFYKEYNHKLRNLTHNYPIKYISKETKLPLWSGLKKFPHAISFNNKQKPHISFIYLYSTILAQALNIKQQEKNENHLLDILAKITVKEHVPVKNITTEYNEEIVKEIKKAQETFLTLHKELKSKDNSSLCNRVFSPIILKIENEGSNQIEFINVAANIRGSNYGIEEVKLFVK